MSTRAYKITQEELTASDPTFNVSEHFSWLEDIASYSSFNHNGECVKMCFEKETIQEWIKEKYKNDKIEVLKLILKEMGEDERVSYECY